MYNTVKRKGKLRSLDEQKICLENRIAGICAHRRAICLELTRNISS
jgi:hypothetical protein